MHRPWFRFANSDDVVRATAVRNEPQRFAFFLLILPQGLAQLKIGSDDDSIAELAAEGRCHSSSAITCHYLAGMSVVYPEYCIDG